MIRFEIIHFSIESSSKTRAYLADLLRQKSFVQFWQNTFEILLFDLQLDLDYS